MGKIVAIGGGEISKHETLFIDKEIIKLSGKKNPKVLFIPTASSDSQGYINDFNNYYGKYLKCKVDILLLINQKIDLKEMTHKILSSNIIYVGGGNTLMMMKLWRKLGVDKVLGKAYKKGIVLSGISAGAICWFKFGNSDSRRFKKPEAPMIKVRALGLLNGLLCPHYHSKKYSNDRALSLKEMMKKTPGISLAIDDYCAAIFVDGKYKIMISKDGSNAYKIYWKQNKFYKEKIEQDLKFELIDKLFRKDFV